MPRTKLPVVLSDRDGSGSEITKHTLTADGISIDNSTEEVTVTFDNDSGGAIVLEQINAPNIEDLVDNMAVANKDTVSVADGETYVFGPWRNSEYGNTDPDNTDIPNLKAVLINVKTGTPGGKIWATRRGAA